MKKLVSTLSFLFLFSFLGTGFCFAQSTGSESGTGSGITFESVENDLFPTWRGSGIQNESKIRTNMTKQETDELATIEGVENDLKKSIEEKEVSLKSLEETKATLEGEFKTLQSNFYSKGCFGAGTEKGTPACTALETTLSQKNSALSAIKQKIADLEKEIVKTQESLLYRGQVKDAFFTRVWNHLNIYPKGVVGFNTDEHFLIQYIPLIIEILMKFFAPVVVVILIYTGVRFVYAGDKDEELGKAKQNLMFAFAGFLLVVLSYSLMKAIYYFFM